MAKHIVDWDLNHTYSGMILPKFTLHDLKAVDGHFTTQYQPDADAGNQRNF